MNSEVLRIMSAILEDFLKGKALMNEIRSEDISDKIFDQTYEVFTTINEFLIAINNRKIKQVDDKLEDYYNSIGIDDDDDFGDLPKINRLNY